MEFAIYFQVVLYTLVTGWFLMDNVKLAAKYAVGVRMHSGKRQGDLEQSLVRGAE